MECTIAKLKLKKKSQTFEQCILGLAICVYDALFSCLFLWLLGLSMVLFKANIFLVIVHVTENVFVFEGET